MDTSSKLMVVAILIMIYEILSSTNITSEVKSGQKILVCNYETVPPNKIVGFNDNTGYWTFTNGYAKNCKIITKGGKR